MSTQVVKKLEEAHVAIWNEKDRAKRDSLMATVYSEKIKMYDKEFILTGIKEVSDFIDKLFSQDPNFYFAPAKSMDSSQNSTRLFWTIKTGGNNLSGMDFFILEDDLVLHLYVYMD